MRPTPTVSVVIAVRNRSDYLRQALISLINQTFQDWEAIVVDDHSSEPIEEVISQFDDERIKYYQNTGKGGISPSRNLGNSKASAPWIAVLDSDDLALPRRLERSLQYVNEHPLTDIVYSNVYRFQDGEYDFKIWKRTRAYDREILYKKNYLVHSATMYRKELVVSIAYDEEIPGSVGDYDLWLSLADRHAVFGFIEEGLTLYRQHGEQVVTDTASQNTQELNAQLVQLKHLPFL